MRKVWVVVGNRAEMNIYYAENVKKLVHIKTLHHNESQLHKKDLSSDKQGSHRGSFGTDTMEAKTPAKVKEANHFAHQVAQFLEDGVNHQQVERIYLIANPEFIGILRQTIKPHVAKIIEKEIHKDLMHSTPEQIRDYLPPVL